MLLIQCGSRDDTACVDGVDGRDDEREEHLVHNPVGDARNLKITVGLIELRVLEVVGPHGVGRLITRVWWDNHIIVGEGMVNRWLGHILEVHVKGVGFALRLGVRRKLPFHLLDGGVAWFPYNRRKALVGEAILDFRKVWGGQTLRKSRMASPVT